MAAFNKKPIRLTNPGVWAEGEYVEIKKKFNVSDQAAIRSALLERVPNIHDVTEAELEKYAMDAQVVTLQQMIVGWKLFDDDGQEVECTPENIAGMDGDYADFVFGALGDTAAVAPMTEQEKKHS